jgi:hypothetical protein
VSFLVANHGVYQVMIEVQIGAIEFDFGIGITFGFKLEII